MLLPPVTSEESLLGSSPSATTWSRRPSSLNRPCATSTRKPSTPRSSQKRQHVDEHVADLGVAPVQVGLGGVEQVEVPLAVLDLGPRGAAEDRAPVVGRGARRAPSGLVAEEVALALGAARAGGQRGPEPLVLVRGVVRHEVDDHLEAELVRALEQRVGVGEGAEERVDVAVVGHVVAVVVLRRGVERRDPQRVHPEVAQVRQPAGDAGQVADPVTVAVGEAADVDLVGDGVAPPLVLIVQTHAVHGRHGPEGSQLHDGARPLPGAGAALRRRRPGRRRPRGARRRPTTRPSES